MPEWFSAVFFFFLKKKKKPPNRGDKREKKKRFPPMTLLAVGCRDVPNDLRDGRQGYKRVSRRALRSTGDLRRSLWCTQLQISSNTSRRWQIAESFICAHRRKVPIECGKAVYQESKRIVTRKPVNNQQFDPPTDPPRRSFCIGRDDMKFTQQLVWPAHQGRLADPRLV